MSEAIEKLYHVKTGIKTSTFYNQKKLEIFSKLIKTKADQINAKSLPVQVFQKSAKPCNKLAKKEENHQKELLMSTKRNKLKRKTKNVVSDFERLTSCKASDITDLQIGKRTLGNMDGKSNEQEKRFKKIKLDLNKNISCREKCSSQRKLFTKVKVVTDNSLLYNNDLIPLSDEDSLEETVQDSKHNMVLTTNEQENTVFVEDSNNDVFASSVSCCLSENSELSQKNGRCNSPDINCKIRSPKTTVLDAFVIKEKTQTSNISEMVKDSGFHEPFSILGESSSQEDMNCSSTGTSPLLFTQSSMSGSSKSKSVSPTSQSSITKYFTPVRKSNSVATVLKSNNVSPSSDKKGKLHIKGRKVNSPTDSPVSNKKEQMFLDLGQKNFGHITCPTCNMVYTSAQPEDEAYHVKFHHKVVSALRFKGWKTERVVEHFDDGRVIVVLPQDPPAHLKKVASVRTVVDDELGFSSETSQRMQDSKTYLFIADKKVVGCVVAVVIQEAFPLLPCPTDNEKIQISEQGAWCCSAAPARAQCGISRVWVLQQYRRKKIATRILDCVRNDFMFSGVISKEMLAFSDPTPHGKQLAESYCGTEHFLVFR